MGYSGRPLWVLPANSTQKRTIDDLKNLLFTSLTIASGCGEFEELVSKGVTIRRSEVRTIMDPLPGISHLSKIGSIASL